MNNKDLNKDLKPAQSPERRKARREGKKKAALRIGAHTWNDLQHMIENKGLQRCIHEMDKLTGKDYVYAYLALMEYVKPKLQRKVIVDETPKSDTFGQVLAALPADEKLKIYKMLKAKKEAQTIEITAEVTTKQDVNLPAPQLEPVYQKPILAEPRTPTIKTSRKSKANLQNKYASLRELNTKANDKENGTK